ncbi:hypothetical protein AMS68_007981 [Peltaster fructicola]|uniref:Casein kinase II beta 2 subunit n=1 Tax=Peltaster fructicola TaxID=286661 RepID=A0A6H0Y614_9PEZI|nr:hypothetical protein AMS68_007981 [Peltaster fructicola]
MPPLPGMVLNWHSLIARHAKELKTALTKVTRAIDAQVARHTQPQAEAILVRNAPKQPLHPLARIRQSQSRFYSTVRGTIRQFSSGSKGRTYDRSSYSKSRVGSYISQSSGRAPFASTLRPNLTGGTLSRTSGGYSLGSGRVGGARYFSHGPASQAQVVHNVSQAMRAFFIGGNKAQFDGMSPRTGEKSFKAVSTLQHDASKTMRSVTRTTPGSWVDFRINPTITALTPLRESFDVTTSIDKPNGHLNSEGLIDVLSADFSRTLKDLAVVLNDLKRLSQLGDLPITHQGNSIRVHFPGCDAGTVERLCAELDLQRGTVTQDPAFDSFVGAEMALLFPYAPSTGESDTESMFEAAPARQSPVIQLEDLLLTSERSGDSSNDSAYSEFQDVLVEETYMSSPSAFESVRSGSEQSDRCSPLEYQGIEGIYRFIEQCDSTRR